MGLLILLQVVLDLAFIATATWLLIERSKEKTMEDPRLSKGLQLLSSKIAILQDLMDRSETMSKQLTHLIDGKKQDIQEQIEEVEAMLHKFQSAAGNAEEISFVFQERAPNPRETVERQNSLKYVQAAKMAHQGLSVDEIAKQVDIPRGELELIAKVNRERLIVEEKVEALVTAPEDWSLNKSPAAPVPANEPAMAVAPAAAAGSDIAAPEFLIKAARERKEEKPKNIRPVVFKRISVLDDLG